MLIVEDDEAVARAVQRVLSAHDVTAEHATTLAEVEALLARRDPPPDWDAIICDVDLGDESGLDVLARLRDAECRSAVIMLTGDATARTATAALRGGAFHYLVKPLHVPTLLEVLDDAVRHTAVHADRAASDATDPSGMLGGSSPVMVELRRKVARVAASGVSVLIIGESGTGKEVVARAIHRASPRADRPFVAINCGAIPEGLIDSELFGHTRGAFTGATSARPGVFVEASGGTLFLDEIGDMPLPVQARLLRALQQKEVRPVGSDTPRPVDVRVIAATNVDLGRAVEDGKFRADLYFRLDVVNLAVPPLRERREDIPALIAVLLQRHAGPQRPTIDDDALDALVAFSWPGNVRELENALQHALTMSRGGHIDLASLPPSIRALHRPARIATGSVPLVVVEPTVEPGLSLTEAKRRAAAEFERAYLVRLIESANGSISAAARIASIDRTNFRRLLQRHNIDPRRYKS
ncbi:MAG: sigma-54-dependent Fis family transcriptional regulator [Kofleriaceae bacterium]|nr:sigma-54-dependent Fis family transcriptional regulator [Kofleriaceae bacterium]MCL4225742.1 sigma-54 dependent transcriptional regulator [Myxococcales bacterium]